MEFYKDLYQKILDFLSQKGIDITRGYGYGPSRKLKLISLGLRYLGLSKFEYHGIKREFYLFPLWFDRPFNKLVDYWKERWALPRAERALNWKNFNTNKFLRKIKQMLKEV